MFHLIRYKKIIFIALLIFVFAVVVRLWNFNNAGRVWDEQSILEKGYIITELVRKGDFANSFWYKDAADHPIFAFYFIGISSYGDLIHFDPQAPTTFSPGSKGAPIFPYDLTYGRLLSVFISSLAVVLVFLIGVRYFSLFVGIVASIILATLPHFVGYSQQVELESWRVLFFTACAFSYFLFLEKNKSRYLVLTGVLTGMTLQIKQSEIFILVLYLATYIAWKVITKKRNIKITHFITLGIITMLTTFIVYPMPWFHLVEFTMANYSIWLKDGGLIPEVIFGKLMGTRAFYYPLAFFITTPLIVILLSFIGFKKSFDNRKKWIYSALIIWFFVPFVLTAYTMRQHMVRYILEFYVPLALLAAIGYELVISKITKKQLTKYLLIIPLCGYLLFTLSIVTPYYLSYYNELVGGTKNVYDKKWFSIGWWGEGLKNPGLYLAKHAKKNAVIGLALNPTHTLYRVPYLRYETFEAKGKYDYVVLNDYNITRIGFDEKILDKEYKIVYRETVAGADIARVYKRK